MGEIKKDNTFVVDNLFPGSYAISVTSVTGDAYLRSAHLGTTDALESGLRVGRAAPSEPLELVLSPFGASVEGAVTKAQDPMRGGTAQFSFGWTLESSFRPQVVFHKPNLARLLRRLPRANL